MQISGDSCHISLNASEFVNKADGARHLSNHSDEAEVGCSEPMAARTAGSMLDRRM